MAVFSVKKLDTPPRRVVWVEEGGGGGGVGTNPPPPPGGKQAVLCGSQLVVLGFGVQVCMPAWGCTAPLGRGEEGLALRGQLRRLGDVGTSCAASTLAVIA
jgi:hypothetical protein